MYILCSLVSSHFFFFNDTATTEFYTLSLHDALPILGEVGLLALLAAGEHRARVDRLGRRPGIAEPIRSEEHTSELQSRGHLVCRLLLEKKKKYFHIIVSIIHTA